MAEPIEVTQADREAAAAFWEDQGLPAMKDDRRTFRAFARHARQAREAERAACAEVALADGVQSEADAALWAKYRMLRAAESAFQQAKAGPRIAAAINARSTL